VIGFAGEPYPVPAQLGPASGSRVWVPPAVATRQAAG